VRISSRSRDLVVSELLILLSHGILIQTQFRLVPKMH